MIYQVAFDSFHGPLDLLLYLVKRNEVDVRDIPVARIAEQFGGGGHRLASGAIREVPLEEARTRVLSAVATALAQLDR